MFTTLTGYLEIEDPELAESIYRFRHKFFVDGLRWEACRKPDELERDQFDGPESLHVVYQEAGEIVSYARLLPTTRPHLLSHVYPQILQGGIAPTGPHVYEWTRHAVAAKKREAKGPNTFSHAAFGAVALVVEAMGWEGLLVQTHPVIVDRLMDMGWDVEPLALPMPYDGALLMPIFARLTEDTIATGRAACAHYGLDVLMPGQSLPARVPQPDLLVA